MVLRRIMEYYISSRRNTHISKVELKQPIVDEIKASLEGAQGVVVVDYRGLTVEQDTQLRKQLREAGVVYKVYKNTLVKRAIAGTEFEPMAEVLEGPNAIAICKEDATAPARSSSLEGMLAIAAIPVAS